MAPVWHRVEEDRARRLRRRPSRPGRRARPGRLRGTTDHPVPPPAVAPAGGVTPLFAHVGGEPTDRYGHTGFSEQTPGEPRENRPAEIGGGSICVAVPPL